VVWIHIGAALLGHLNLEPTRGYVKPRELHQTGENPQVTCPVRANLSNGGEYRVIGFTNGLTEPDRWRR
jgi:hypothetical protein